MKSRVLQLVFARQAAYSAGTKGQPLETGFVFKVWERVPNAVRAAHLPDEHENNITSIMDKIFC